MSFTDVCGGCVGLLFWFGFLLTRVQFCTLVLAVLTTYLVDFGFSCLRVLRCFLMGCAVLLVFVVYGLCLGRPTLDFWVVGISFGGLDLW